MTDKEAQEFDTKYKPSNRTPNADLEFIEKAIRAWIKLEKETYLTSEYSRVRIRAYESVIQLISNMFSQSIY